MIEVDGTTVEVVDGQIHVWPTEGEESWLDPTNVHRGAKAMVIEDLMAEMDGAGVDRAIIVPPGFVPVDNTFAVDVARRYPERFAVMAKIATDTPSDLAPLFASPEVLGFRATFNRGKAADRIVDGTAEWFFDAAQAIGAPVMVYAPGKTDALRGVLERHPDLRLIVDHGGLPSTPAPMLMEEIVAEAIPLAIYPNVAVKASAFACATVEPFPFPMAQRAVRILVDAFGADRVFWGTDLTRIPCTYTDAVRFLTVPGGLSADELVLVMGRGIERFLGWPARS